MQHYCVVVITFQATHSLGYNCRDVLGLCLLKASGAIIWGADDVLKVNFSELPEMHGFGDSALTLGLFFASIGFSCIFGPLIFNYLTPPK